MYCSKMLPPILLLWKTRLLYSAMKSLLRLELIQDKKSIHLHCSLCPCRSCSRDHSFFWSKIKIFVYTTPLPPGFQISIPEVELQHSMPSTCASHLCATSSPHSFGVTGLTPNCKFLALNISSCGETLPLPYKSMLSLQVDTNPFLWLSSASFLAFILW